jgi:heme exporter protein C
MKLPAWFHRLGSPPRFYALAGAMLPWAARAAALLIAAGLVGGLVLAPADYQQGDSYRIIFVHVPSAWLSLFGYVFMAANAGIALVWRVKVAEALARAAAPLGASFTFLALVTGSLWGKPMWGTWWVWDARLTSELLLLFLYLGYMALDSAIGEPRRAARASGILAVVGVVNVPIIHYSVQWWNTLHQGPTVMRFDAPAIHVSMLVPLLLIALGFMAYFFAVVLLRAQCEMLERERNSRWANRLATEGET